MHRYLLFLAGGILMAGSCRNPKPADAGPVAATPVAPLPEPIVETVVGRITLLGAENSFVVFLLEPGQSVSMGEELEVRFAGSKVGAIKITPPDKGNRLYAADVVEGSVEKGYDVVRVEGGQVGEPSGGAGPQ